MKACGKCGTPHSRIVRTGPGKPVRFAAWCLACHAAYMRENRPKHSQLAPEQRRRANCRAYANVLQKRGKIKPGPCEVCGEPAQKHHEDYSKPADVKWLCRLHHIDLHLTFHVSQTGEMPC